MKFKNNEDQATIDKFKSGIQKGYDDQGSAYYSTGRLWDDGIVKASDLRRILGLSLSASLNAQIHPTDAGVFRM